MYKPYLCYNFANYFLFLLISVHQPQKNLRKRLFAISVDHHAHTIAVDCYDQRMVC